MRPKIVELRPNHRLLEPNFEGYKVSLNKIPTSELELENGIDSAQPASSQYSLLHARLFGVHNHLEGEVIGCCEIVYFIDKRWNVIKATLDTYTGDFNEPCTVFNIPRDNTRTEGEYNSSLKFASTELAALSDGSGKLYLLSTGKRDENYAWTCIFNDYVLPEKECFVIQDIIEENNSLHLLLLTVKQLNDKYGTMLYWITLNKAGDETWNQVAMRAISSKGSVIYSNFEQSAKAVYLMGDGKFTFTIDSENPIKNEDIEIESKKFVWFQDLNTITISFKLENDYNKDELTIRITKEEIDIRYKDFEVLSGKLLHAIDADNSKWTSFTEEFTTVKVVLNKLEENQMWPEIVPGNNCGECVVDEKLAEEIHKKLQHLCSETLDNVQVGETFNSERIEECDFEEDKIYTFQRLILNTHDITHSANLSGRQVLLTAKLSGRALAFALRHDVDACLWQPELEGEEFSLKHVGTLHAFGYIQASKQQRKFSACPPDLSYSVICESARHIFIYRQQVTITRGELRQRSTGRRVGTIAQQYVVNLNHEEVFGIYATTNNLFILTKNKLHVLKMT